MSNRREGGGRFTDAREKEGLTGSGDLLICLKSGTKRARREFMRHIILTIDAITQTSMHVFAITILWIIIAGQRARAKNPEEPAAAGRWGRVRNLLLWPHREYALRKRNHWVIWLNLASAALVLLGFVLLPLLAWLSRG